MSNDDDDEEESLPKGPPAWLVSFADLMSLMLVFFVLLFSMSSVEPIKANLIIGSLHSTFRIDGPRIESKPEVNTIVQFSQPSKEYLNKITKLFEENFEIDKSNITNYGEQMRLIINMEKIFEPGTPDIKPGNEEFFNQLVQVMRDIQGTDRPQVYMFFHTLPKDPESFTTIKRASGLAQALVDQDMPPEFISTGIVPLQDNIIEFYFYLYDAAEISQSFEETVLE